MILRKKGFTLIEMLVVIAIIAILAAALFPAIQSALDSARATAMKNKGRGIWIAVVSANSEREPLGSEPVWPSNMTISGTMKSPQYFSWLMSGGDTDVTTIADTQNSICSDLKVDSLAGAGVPTAAYPIGTKLIKAANCAWHVSMIGDTTPSDCAFLLTKNMTVDASGNLTTTLIGGNNVVTLDPSKKPFGQNRGVWVTRGGGIFDARKKYLTDVQVKVTNVVWECTD